MSENPRPFCRRHSSHFCPCVAPEMYNRSGMTADTYTAEDWDEPLRRKREDEVEPRQQGRRKR